jgi:hypothetical protein
MNEEYCRWLSRVLDRKALDSLLPAKILDSDNQQLAIGLVTPDKTSDHRTFWADSPTIPDSLLKRGTILRYADGREVEIFDLHQSPSPFAPLHVDFRIRFRDLIDALPSIAPNAELLRNTPTQSMRLFLKAADWIAILNVILAITVLLPVLVFQGILGVLGAWGSMFWYSSDAIIFIVVSVSVAWCVFRWKELTKRP